MNKYEEAIMESKIEAAENKIRRIHNEIESEKFWGKKRYLPYENKKLIDMITLIKKETP